MTEQYVTKKTRITAHIRDGIIAKALETSGVNGRKIALIDNRAALAEDVRRACLLQSGFESDDHLRKAIADLNKQFQAGSAVRKFLKIEIDAQTYQRFNVNLGGMDIYMWLDGRPFSYSRDDLDKTHLTVNVQMAQKDEATARFVPRSRPDLAAPELQDRFIALENEQEAIKGDEEKLTAVLRSTIKKFGTVETMIEVWPDVEELLPDELQPSKALAITPEDLNAICGIPTGK